ncbi:MAG: PEGA domain-containing protein [Terriglobia bacterium]|jgi:predicted Ser/Thr protein kinase
MADALTKAGRYEVVRELGRGSMGVVYQGYDPVIGRTVAIKTMLTEGLTSQEFQEFRARFQREARAAGVLSHPNIVNVFDYGEDSGILYLIMEYLEGKSLEKLVEGQNILPIETIIPIYDQVCSALDHAHQHSIVHRDIKPANIMILDNGLVKVTDFGIAKMMSMGMTQAGQVLGTPNYMSPEQVKGRQIDGRSDIFSLGIILYDLVTGEMPFAGQNITTVIYKIINENPIPPRELDATIHPGLSYVICKALAKSPDERYQTCRELAYDLKNFKYVGGPAVPSATAIFKVPPLPSTDLERAAAPPVEISRPPAAPAEPARIAPIQQPSPEQAPVQVIAPTPTYQKPRTLPMVWVLMTLLGVVILGILGGGGYFYLHKGKPQVANPPVGQLHVESNIPGARISVDGLSGPNWVTPCTIPDLSPGSHQVLVTKEGYDDYQQEVTIEGGKINSVNASLPAHAPEPPSNTLAEKPAATGGKSSTKASEARGGRPPTKAREAPGAIPLLSTSVAGPGATPLPSASGGGLGATSLPSASGGGPSATPTMGQLLVTADVAGAKISVDGSSQPNWVTPYSSTITRPAGTHQVVISKEGYGDYQQSVTIEGGKTTTINAQLSAAKGEVAVTTTPPGLDVLIDGKLIGPSPVRLTVVAGSHKYTVRRPGWEPYEGTFTVRSGALVTVRVNMGG